MGGCMGILGVVIFAILTVLSGLWYGDWFKVVFIWIFEAQIHDYGY